VYDLVAFESLVVRDIDIGVVLVVVVVAVLVTSRSSKEYSFPVNFPLKAEAMAKEDFHYWDRNSREQSIEVVMIQSGTAMKEREGAYRVVSHNGS
jgi:hypothetical protein